jgi:hypothetical protein
MKKELTKKILLTVGLALIISLLVYRIVYDIKGLINQYHILDMFTQEGSIFILSAKITIIKLFVFIFLDIIIVLFIGFLFAKIWKKQILKVIYSFQDYKIEKSIKNNEKKKKKQERLEKKLEKLKSKIK